VIGLAVGFIMMTIGSLIATKFKTREKSAAWFDSLKLDWVSGVGLAFVIVFGWMVVVKLCVGK
jgi:hypothetical protein